MRAEEAGMYVEKVREILSQHGRLGTAVGELSDEADLYDAGLTSLATVGVMLALEDAFDIEFPDAVLTRRTFGSIGSLASVVEGLAGAPMAVSAAG
jgi:acyl carrier protein